MSSASEGRYALAAIAVFYVSTRVLRIGPGHIFALLLTAALIYNARSRDKLDRQTRYERIDMQIRAIGSPRHFYVDSNAVDFFYDYIGWRALNPDNYDKAVTAVDNVLRILVDTEKPLVRSVDHYRIAADFGALALNMMHAYVYVVDEPILIDKLGRALERLQGLVSKYLRQMRHNCAAIERGKGRRDVNWSFVPEESVPHPYDPTETGFNFYGPVG